MAGTTKLKGSSWIQFNRIVALPACFFISRGFFPMPQLNSSKHSQTGFRRVRFFSLSFFSFSAIRPHIPAVLWSRRVLKLQSEPSPEPGFRPATLGSLRCRKQRGRRRPRGGSRWLKRGEPLAKVADSPGWGVKRSGRHAPAIVMWRREGWTVAAARCCYAAEDADKTPGVLRLLLCLTAVRK